MEEVRLLDLRRQAQIENQVAAINRLLEGDATYDTEMRILHEQLAEAKVQLAEAKVRIAELEGGRDVG